MKLDNVFKKTRIAVGRKNYITFTRRPEVPEGLLRKCNKCGGAIIAEDVKKDHYICPKCGGYFRVHARRRIEMVTDEGSFEEWDSDLQGGNPLEYKGYEEKLEKLQEKTGLSEAVITGKAKIDGRETAIGVCDGRFLMASMGEAVGEKIARAVERATEERLPVILFACSGGARMQEGIVSLMQMAKTSAALKYHSDAGLLYISILTDPTTGGVTASFAMLGDVILAEPKALIGFAGPRVIEQTIGQKLPEGFQRAEFLLEHGFLDAIVERPQMKAVLSKILALHENGKGTDFNRKECAQDLVADGRKEEKLTAWQRVELSRRKDRPVGSDYIDALFTDFVEFHGDRYFADDKAIIGGVARFRHAEVSFDIFFRISSLCLCDHRYRHAMEPEGYRKALRLMKQAEKFARPVICLVDTPGAFCGLEAEERGQGEAIARNIYEMSGLKVPVVSIIIGEGGSGGALAMATADEVWMLENSIYSILSPEGFASILWKDSSKAKEAAEVMKLTAENLKAQGIVERVFAEPETYTVQNMDSVIMQINEAIEEFLMRYGSMSEQELIRHRYERFRNM